MAGDNQNFCLRWNHYQSTLISVFDMFLESGTLVDCTLTAEGQYLKAHKVVLSACSPYLQLLLSQHYEKHPIVILKDVKFQELKNMIDYMYRGEVNISQDQLSTFLKAAESLQIKGLTDGGGNEDSTAFSAPVATPVRKPIQQSVTHGPSTVAQDLTIKRRPESTHIRSRDDSASPTRKRRRNQRRPLTSVDHDIHVDASNSCDVSPLQSGALSGIGIPNIPAAITKEAPLDDGDHETDNSRINNHDASVAEGVAGQKIEPIGELIEPKTENLEDINNGDSIEALTLDDNDDMDNSMDMSRAGPSHDNSNQSFNQCPMSGNQTMDEIFMDAQEAVGAHRDTQVVSMHPLIPSEEVVLQPTTVTGRELSDTDESESDDGGDDYTNDDHDDDVGSILDFNEVLSVTSDIQLTATDVTATSEENGDGNEDIAKLTATIEKSYTCKVCQKQFRFKSWYNKHIAAHAIVKLHYCNNCPKHFKRLDSLERHLSTHFGGKNYDCLECGKTYTYAFNLKHHMVTQHNPNFKQIKCLKCNKSFNDARYLRYHDNRVHTYKTPYACHCGSAYPAPNELYRHSKRMNH
ncbi:longitudinals lacking protein, isoforms H/M/V-like isoform X2 [Acyrthosiphon pisum]|uniref:Uncharacterized protein n=1 Tax=Acyrthosiphon pisum TaxID=7029 RepID=A0A8R2NMB2_ACYPI|nr:longitudinals lacking protein, isoforms H/M/V-like isoform X2 [Acyrthosiphon pisum]